MECCSEMNALTSYLRPLFVLAATLAPLQAAIAQGPAITVIPVEVTPREPGIEFSIANRGPDWITAIGRIDKLAAERFRKFLDANRDVAKPGTVIQFQSHGGDLYAGMEIGAIIQEFSLNTLVGDSIFLAGDPKCSSACTLAFIGGITRIIMPNAAFNIHASRIVRGDGSEYQPDEIVFTPRDIFKEQNSMSLVLRYARNQGVDPSAVAAMYAVFPYGNSEESIRKLTHEELVSWRISNGETPSPEQQRLALHDDRLRQELCPPSGPDAIQQIPRP